MLPKKLPKRDLLKDLEPLGWTHTQPNDLIQNGVQILPATDVITYSGIVEDHPQEWAKTRLS